MKSYFYILLMMLLAFASCKKNNDENTNESNTDSVIYVTLINLQNKAGENYLTWSKTMDSVQVINKLQQFFLSDPSVKSATIGSQGIAVQYSNGMRGGIFINGEDQPGKLKKGLDLIPIEPLTDLDEKSLVNSKEIILLNPHYWERSSYTNWILDNYQNFLPRKVFESISIRKGALATLDEFTHLTGYGIIHIYSHGWAWPNEKNIEKVYLRTGEVANTNSTEKYKEDIKKGNILISQSKVSSTSTANIYYITENFIADHNDFSKDTVLFYGGFCYSFLGGWDQLYKKFAKSSYFGFTWSVRTDKNSSWAVSLVDSLSDIAAKTPYNTEKWQNGINPSKSYYDGEDKKTVSIQYVGDAGLTLWKDSTSIITNPITNITPTNATGGGNIKSDGGFPVTLRGICWSKSPNPTIADSRTLNGGGKGSYVSELTELTPETKYYVRSYAVTSKGTLYGNQVNFTTLAIATPTVSTSGVTNISTTSATCGGNVISDGGGKVTARGVCWNTSPNPTISNNFTTDGNGTGEYVSELTGLTINTNYWVRAYATNSKGTVYGNPEYFSTKLSVFTIGQRYGGGIIFYIDNTGKHGLICALTDQSSGAKWGCSNTSIGGTSKLTGSGQANTLAILNGCNTVGIAALICDQYSVEVEGVKYDDWFLPSNDELGLLAWNNGLLNSGIGDATYWSSTEYNSSLSYCNRVRQNTTYTLDKNSNYSVRAIRVF